MLVLLAAAVAAAPELRLVEYYAPWCPVCQRFESEFLKVANNPLFREKVEFIRVDCDQLETECTTVGVDYFPTLLLIETGSEKFNEYAGELTSDDVEGWIISHMGLPAHHRLAGNVNDVLWGALSTLQNVRAPVPPLLARSLKMFVHDLAEFVPELRQLEYVLAHGRPLQELATKWMPIRPLTADVWHQVMQHAPKIPQELECSSSACAIWTMLHAIVVSVDDPIEALRAATEVVVHTLPCKECAAHFNDSIYGINYDTPLNDVHCNVNAALWVWDVHNNVNKRIGKPVWPGTNCTTCGSRTGVYNELVRTYQIIPQPTLSPSVVMATSALAGPITLLAINLHRRRYHRARQAG